MGRRIERYELEPGDHIYVWANPLYTHHGIYVGDGMVIHFTRTGSAGSSSSSASFPSTNSHGVIEESLDSFIGDHVLYLHEYGMNRLIVAFSSGSMSPKQSDPAYLVIDRAKSALRNGFGTYNVFTNSCEHFAAYCKTGSRGGLSGQVAEVVTDVILPGPAPIKRFIRWLF